MGFDPGPAVSKAETLTTRPQKLTIKSEIFLVL